MTVVLIALNLVFGTLVAWGVIGLYATTRSNDASARTRMEARDRRAADASWLVLKDAARRHLSAVRSDATTLPDDALGDALLDYSQNGQRLLRKPDTDLVDRLAALKRAAAALDDPKRPIRCHGTIRRDDDPLCAKYLDALVDVFGRGL